MKMGKHISSVVLTNTLTLSTCTDGLWLYDSVAGMNLAMRAKSDTEAFVEALTYYQGRLTQVQEEYRALRVKVDSFLDQFIEDDEGDDDE
jgi:hypothetical protein